MRTSHQNSFRDRRPFQADWQKPGVTSVRLSQGEIDGIVSADNPEEQLRKVYLRKTAEPARS
jgi:hypothetical protein